MWGKDNPMFGKESPFKGRKHTEKNKKIFSKQRKGKGLLGENKNAKKVIDNNTGEIYKCAKEVALKFKINYSTLKAWLQKLNTKSKNQLSKRFSYYETNPKT